MWQLVILLRNGVPYEVANSMSPIMRLATLVAIGETLGRTFNWETGAWTDPE